ncbi:MAG: dicarboxylate/amino acid:cation symporter [Proteobacteria bacterium]|nr:dicarboxylate/amino acid:cation symporter [Pseudomonadota bacterium]
MQRFLTLFVLVGLILGIAVGWVLHQQYPADHWPTIAGYFKVVTDLFLRLIRMIIAPLVLSTLVVGIAHMGGTGSLGRVGVRTLLWFISASIFSLLLGLAVVHWLQPGIGAHFTPSIGDSAPAASALNLNDFVTHLAPTSIFDAMATNSILQIVVFAVFFGVALASLGEQGRPVVDLAERVSHVMLRVTGYVMNLAPLAVFAAIASTVTEKGLDIIRTYASFIGGFYLALAILWTALIGAGLLIVGPRMLRLIGLVRDPTVLAFSTASSEAAYPRTFEALQRFGISKRIAGFVLPLGYSFNLDGSMMYCTFAVIFISQVFNHPLPIEQQLTMLLVLMVTSKGMAGVPRASLVVIAATLTQFGLPQEGLLLILGVDHFLDMGRSATNVIGNSVATAVVATWERELGPERAVVAPGEMAPPIEDAGDREI